MFKAMLVGDIKTVLQLQKAILQSNSTRLLSIRLVTQVCVNKRIAGIDGKTCLTFLERFELNESLKLRVNNWVPQSLKCISVLRSSGETDYFEIATVSDRVWQVLIKFSIEPAQEASFHPRNFNVTSIDVIYRVQKLISSVLSDLSFGAQKRVLSLNLSGLLVSYSKNFILENLISLRSVKICIGRLLAKDIRMDFSSPENISAGLINLLINVVLNGIEDLHNSLS